MSRLEVHDVVVDRVRDAARRRATAPGLVTNNVKEASGQWRVLVPVDELFEVDRRLVRGRHAQAEPGHLPARARAARRHPLRHGGLPRRRARQRRRRSPAPACTPSSSTRRTRPAPWRSSTSLLEPFLTEESSSREPARTDNGTIRGIDGRSEEAAGALRALGPPGAARLVHRRGVGPPGRQLQVDRDEAVRGARRLGRHRARARREDAPRHALLPPRLARRAVAQAPARAARDEPGPPHRAAERRAGRVRRRDDRARGARARRSRSSSASTGC